MNDNTPKVCPNCGSPRLKTWDELDRDEKIVAERLPDAAEYTSAEREKHRFCTRCWFKMKQVRDELA